MFEARSCAAPNEIGDQGPKSCLDQQWHDAAPEIARRGKAVEEKDRKTRANIIHRNRGARDLYRGRHPSFALDPPFAQYTDCLQAQSK
jgi:hypothetical protein